MTDTNTEAQTTTETVWSQLFDMATLAAGLPLGGEVQREAHYTAGGIAVALGTILGMPATDVLSSAYVEVEQHGLRVAASAHERGAHEDAQAMSDYAQRAAALRERIRLLQA